MELAEQQGTLHHFSHQHPLLQCTISTSAETVTCYGCNLQILPGKVYYNCKSCLFSLHRVCSSTPRKAQHPAHPNRCLMLMVSPPSANCTLNCGVCQQSISGFYYNVSGCSIYYHVLCSALPLSVMIPSHPHTLKMQSSPSYDFRCDLCEQPSYEGWLYRCRFCEFDAHTACAISDQIEQSKPLIDSWKNVPSLTSSADTNRQIDFEEAISELIQLMAQQRTVGGNVMQYDRDTVTTLAGCDERLPGPKEDLKTGSPVSGQIGLYQAKTYNKPRTFPTTGEQSRDQDPSTPISEDLTVPSYQFSDSCFSIDLLNSYSSNDRANPATKEATYQDNKVVPEAEAEAKISFDIVVAHKKYLSDSHQLQPQQDDPNKMVTNPQLDKKSLAGDVTFYDKKPGQNEERRIANRAEGRSCIKEQVALSDTASSGCSFWRKLLTVCSYPRYRRCSRSLRK